MKKCLIIRYGAAGDMVFMTPLLRLLKQDGYHITINTHKRGKEILKCNPYIDEYLDHIPSLLANEQVRTRWKDIISKINKMLQDGDLCDGRQDVYAEMDRFMCQDLDTLANDYLDVHWAKISKGYDKVINLSGSIEGSLLKVPWKKDFYQSKEELAKTCNVNYIDRTLELGGYPNTKGKKAEMHFSVFEHDLCKRIRIKHFREFLILWPLSGSSPHKAYPHSELLAEAILRSMPEATIIVTGDKSCHLIEWPPHPRVKSYVGKWPIRKAMCMTQYVDLVIGGDTGVLQAAGCFDTPKVLILSSTTEENIAKYWTNYECVSANVECQPCYKLHYSVKTCNTVACIEGLEAMAAQCMMNLMPGKVFKAIAEVYKKWQRSHKIITLPTIKPVSRKDINAIRHAKQAIH